MIIVGAGLSGINAAYRVQTELPGYSYTVLESRNAIGGTWDLFRYPGIRSDSDLHTFGFPWRPWTDEKVIAGGTLIRNYIRDSAEEFGIDSKIRFHHKLLAANWSSEKQSVGEPIFLLMPKANQCSDSGRCQLSKVKKMAVTPPKPSEPTSSFSPLVIMITTTPSKSTYQILIRSKA